MIYVAIAILGTMMAAAALALLFIHRPSSPEFKAAMVVKPPLVLFADGDIMKVLEVDLLDAVAFLNEAGAGDLVEFFSDDSENRGTIVPVIAGVKQEEPIRVMYSPSGEVEALALDLQYLELESRQNRLYYLTHALGHALGLEDNSSNYVSFMYNGTPPLSLSMSSYEEHLLRSLINASRDRSA